MPDLRLYRVVLVIAVILAAASLLALKSPQTVALSTQPTGFDGQAAMSSVRTLAQGYPGRVAGSAADRRSAGWVAAQLADDGLTTHVETFNATIAGRPVSLNNVWAVSTGDVEGAIVVLAPRDSPPLSTQGADNDASGTAALLELASVFAGAAHNHPLVFVSSDGDTDGALGAQAFLDRHHELPIVAVVTLRRVAGRDVHDLTVNGWSARPLLAPPWLWSLARVAGREGGGMDVPLPPVTSQILRLAVPSGGGSQAPFVAAGLPAIELSAPGPAQPAVADTLDSVSADTLTRTGRTAEVLVSSLDGAPLPLQGSSSTVFFSRYRQLSGGVVVWILLVLATPLAVVTIDLLARARRLRLPLRHAALRLALRAAPWLLTLALVYLANLLSLLPGGFGGPVSPDAVVSHTPRYLRVLLILLFLALAYHYAMAVERRLARRYPADTQAVVAVTHLALLVVAILIVPINPFSLALDRAGRPALATGSVGLLDAFAAAGVGRCRHRGRGPGLLRRAAAPGLGCLVVFLPAAGDPGDPDGGDSRGGRLRRLGGAARTRAALAGFCAADRGSRPASRRARARHEKRAGRPKATRPL